MKPLASAFVGLLLHQLCCSAPTILKRDEASNNPAVNHLLRRAFHASVVLGDYLYIDGGEISQLVDGIADPGVGSVYSRQENVTLLVPLNTSWTNVSVSINSIPKGQAPVLSTEILWKSPDGKSCYMWAGARSNIAVGGQPPPLELWQFTSDGVGGGLWSQVPVSDPAFSNLLRQAMGSGTTIGDMAYYLGGYVGTHTDPSIQSSDVCIPGIISFNMTSRAWSNDSTTGLNTAGMAVNQAVVSIPAFGLDGRGLLFIFGGRDPGANPWSSATEQWYDGTLLSLSNISIYDPYIGNWYSQHASGDVPGPRERFCAVSIAGDNNTYEVFVYGGVNTDSWVGYNEVYVLTIPGFVWFKAPTPSNAPRFQHTCEIIGNRQLLIIGGLDNGGINPFYPYIWQEQDPNNQSLAVLDMTNMEWSSSYDADAAAYQSPSVVKDWYNKGSQTSVQWQSKEIARMFVRDTPITVNPTPAAAEPASSTAASTTSGGGLTNDNKISIVTGLFGSLASLLGGVFAGRQMSKPKKDRIWSKWVPFKSSKSKKGGKASKDASSSLDSSLNSNTILPVAGARVFQASTMTPAGSATGPVPLQPGTGSIQRPVSI